jgi:hypothetical protein
MRHRTVRNTLMLFVFALVLTTIALAQSSISPIEIGNTANHTWESAQMRGSSDHKLIVVTLDQPHHAQTCRVKSFTTDKLVCKLAFGRRRTYLPKQVAALIRPGDDALRVELFLGFNGGLGAAIWGTVVLAATCPACAAATAFAALVFFAAAGAIAYVDGQSEFLLYLAPGYKLTGRLRHLQP